MIVRFSTVPLLKKRVFIVVLVVNFRTPACEIDVSYVTRWKLVPTACQKILVSVFLQITISFLVESRWYLDRRERSIFFV